MANINLNTKLQQPETDHLFIESLNMLSESCYTEISEVCDKIQSNLEKKSNNIQKKQQDKIQNQIEQLNQLMSVNLDVFMKRRKNEKIKNLGTYIQTKVHEMMQTLELNQKNKPINSAQNNKTAQKKY